MRSFILALMVILAHGCNRHPSPSPLLPPAHAVTIPSTSMTPCGIASHYLIPCSIANKLIEVESNGNPNAERFERHEYYRLLALSSLYAHPNSYRGQQDYLVDLSTSYDLAQVMGYNAPDITDPRALLNPVTNLNVAFGLLNRLHSTCGSWRAALTAYNTGRCYSPGNQYASNFTF